MDNGMASSNVQISARQFMILVFMYTIGDSMFVIPTLIADTSKQDAWISMLISLFFGLAAGVLFGLLAKMMKGVGMITFIQRSLGNVAGSLVGLLLLTYFFYIHMTLTSEMSQFMTTQLMPETPINAIVMLFMAVIIIAYRLGVEAFARMGELLFPVFLVLFLFMLVFLLPQIELSKMEPVLAEGLAPVMNGVLSSFTIPFSEVFVILMLAPHVSGKKGTMKPLLLGIALGGAILLITVLLCVLVLGSSLMETKYYPMYILAQKIRVGGFLERIEAILAFIWIVTVFFKTLAIFYAITQGITQLLRLKESNMLTIPLAMILLVGSVISIPNIVVYNEINKNDWPLFDLTVCVLLPILLLGWFYLRRNHDHKVQ
ncbi:endospore germination permease [Paenibacillus sp. PL91]|uniref:GerAB/ArcD/ProY family transporter n=1 Tax=Paenibacillus sp. PL91 TaxID=2729538 RepID=UPI00145F99C7|nr:endospore germination permease [Paenibacillus sp. PL91]MBC9203454.1 endospore germination permease [Paenibacillus sp. PL91]